MDEQLFRVAVLQENSFGRALEKNTDKIIYEMKQAKDQNADILLLPECFLTGYQLPITNEEALDDKSIYIKMLCKKAKEYQIGVVATAFTKGKNKPRNTAFVIDKKGNILMQYDKVHTCDFSDERCLESGDNFHICNFDGIKLGIMICYDREYPESARVLMMKGAELILIPNDCGAMAPRINALSTRAYENMVGVVMANPPGENWGKSCAFSPICWDREGRCIDNTLLLADEKTSGLYFADFDIESLRHYRSHELMGNTYRKVKAYGELLNPAIAEPFVRNF